MNPNRGSARQGGKQVRGGQAWAARAGSCCPFYFGAASGHAACRSPPDTWSCRRAAKRTTEKQEHEKGEEDTRLFFFLCFWYWRFGSSLRGRRATPSGCGSAVHSGHSCGPGLKRSVERDVLHVTRTRGHGGRRVSLADNSSRSCP